MEEVMDVTQLVEQQSEELNDYRYAYLPKETIHDGLIEKSDLPHKIIDDVCIEINSIVKESHTKAPSPKHYIGRVNDRIKSLNEQAYKPMTVIIGPYDTELRKNSHFQAMEHLKRHYLGSTLRGKSEEEVQNVVKKMSDLMKGARQRYAQSTDDVLDHEFLKLMLLDSCFIVKIIRMFYYKEEEKIRKNLKDDPFITDETTRSSIRRDLLLFENQLPFFSLQRFYDLTKAQDESTPKSPSFIKMALHFIQYAIPDACGDDQTERHTSKPPKHLLGLLYDALVQTRPPYKEGRLICLFLRSRIQMIFSLISRIAKWALKSLLMAFGRQIPSGEGKEPVVKFSREGKKLAVKFKLLNCSTDLAENGVKFRKAAYRNCRLFDVKFADGCLIIPPLVVNSHSEAIFLNLLAYERHCASGDGKVVSDYMALMDCLIDSPKDVDLLRRRGIFENLSRDKEEITKLFDRPKDNFIVITQNKFVYREIFQQIDDHCRHPWTRFVVKLSQWMATLWDKYFGSPWSFISLLAATILLVLTAAQTVYTIRSPLP